MNLHELAILQTEAFIAGDNEIRSDFAFHEQMFRLSYYLSTKTSLFYSRMKNRHYFTFIFLMNSKLAVRGFQSPVNSKSIFRYYEERRLKGFVNFN